jgi:hypothetical protein
MESKKINQLATELAPVTTDLTVIGDPITGELKKITFLQVASIIGSGASLNFNDVTTNGNTTGNSITIGGLTITSLNGVLKSTSGVVGTYPYGGANGVATLDAAGKVPVSQLPSSIMEYKGTWNATTNTPTLANGIGDNGDVYRVSVGGTINLGGGAITFDVGDYVIYNGTIWEKSDTTDSVTSVFGRIGVVTAQEGDYNLNLLGDVSITSPLANNYLKYNGTTWINEAFPTFLSSDKLIVPVRNNSGATITKGSVVYINGAVGNKATIALALATTDATSAQTLGLVQDDIVNNAEGYVVSVGECFNLNTSAFTEGTQLYLSPTTAGAYTSTKQSAPNHLVYIGVVVRSHVSLGVIYVKVQNGYELDEIHDVSITTPVNNQGLFWEASTSLWKNKSIATILGFTPISLTSLSATSPLLYNNTTGVFSIQVANSTQNGYLSNTNWNTFNGKMNNPLTSLGDMVYSNASGAPLRLAGNITATKQFLSQTGTGSASAIPVWSAVTKADVGLANVENTALSTWAGSTNITTLGTITSGTWNATTIAIARGGTGLTALGTGLQLLRVNAGATALEYFTHSFISLTGLSATSPLLYNNTSGVFSIQVANTTQNGYLSSTDWNTFNNKQSVTANLTSLSGLAFTSTAFVKMTAANTFTLDTNTYLTANQSITLSGNVTGSGTTAITTTIANNVVSNAMLSQVATATFKGRTTAGTGNVEDLSVTQATALLNVFTTTLKGLTPASGGGTTNFLRADGTWATPAGTGFTNPMTTLGDTMYQGASGVTRLAGNITTAKQYLSQTGTGTISAAPAWSSIAGADVTGAAISTSSDTNILITASGNTSNALLRTMTLTAGWTGQLAVGRGGSGASTLTGILVGNGTSAFTGVTGTANQLLRRNAGNTAYEFFTPTYLTANQTITLSGDVTGSGTTAITTTIGNNAVTLAKFQQIATSSFLGRVTAGTGNAEVLSTTQATSLLNTFTSTLKGLAPASGGGTTNFLRADGTWAAPTSSGVTGSGNATFIPKWNTSTSLTDSSFIDDGTNLYARPYAVYSTISSSAFVVYNATLSGANLAIGVNGLTGVALQARDGTSTPFYMQLNPFGGNVGIGINPSHKLDVNGNIGISGTIYAGKSGNFNLLYDPQGNIGIYVGNATSAYNQYNNTAHFFGNKTGSVSYTTIDSSGARVYGKVVAGTDSSTNGSIILQDSYSNGNLTTIGTNYSSGAPIIGFGVTPSTSSADTFLSATNLTDYPRGALVVSNTLKYFIGAPQTVTIGSAIAQLRLFEIKNNGQMQLPFYTASGSYSGTPAGYLAFDSSGNIITTTGTGGGGGFAYSFTSVTSVYTETATSGYKIILADTTSGAFTINLPTAVGNTALIVIKKTGGSGLLTIDANSTQTIDGSLTATISVNNTSLSLISNNSNWLII